MTDDVHHDAPDEPALEREAARYRAMVGTGAAEDAALVTGGFGAGFADRVMARLEREESLGRGLQLVFTQLAPMAAAAAIVIAVLNLRGTPASGQSLVSRAIGLPAVAKGNIEGWLHPSTYEFPEKASATEQLTLMVAETVKTLKAAEVKPLQLFFASLIAWIKKLFGGRA